ncbi:hypothetical protein PO909_016105 [Leuciscus waleckii]
MDIFKGVMSGLAEGAVGVARAVVDVPVGMVKGAVESVIEASSEIDSASTVGDGVSAAIGLIASPLTGAVSGGAKEIIKAPGKVVQGISDGIDKALDD